MASHYMVLACWYAVWSWLLPLPNILLKSYDRQLFSWEQVTHDSNNSVCCPPCRVNFQHCRTWGACKRWTGQLQISQFCFRFTILRNPEDYSKRSATTPKKKHKINEFLSTVSKWLHTDIAWHFVLKTTAVYCYN